MQLFVCNRLYFLSGRWNKLSTRWLRLDKRLEKSNVIAC